MFVVVRKLLVFYVALFDVFNKLELEWKMKCFLFSLFFYYHYFMEVLLFLLFPFVTGLCCFNCIFLEDSKAKKKDIKEFRREDKNWIECRLEFLDFNFLMVVNEVWIKGFREIMPFAFGAFTDDNAVGFTSFFTMLTLASSCFSKNYFKNKLETTALNKNKIRTLDYKKNGLKIKY